MNIDRIIRSQRKTIAIIVQRDGKIVVRAPKRTSIAQIQSFVDLKSNWIQAKQAEAFRRMSQKTPRQYINGETFFFLGNSYPLEIIDRAHPSLSFEDGRFLLVKNALPHAKDVFTNWYKKQAREVMTERVKMYASQYHLSYEKIRISSARTRWGSCSTRGTLSFTWRLVMAPLPVIDYVVIHELAHTVEENHSHRFWDKIAAMMSDYAKHNQWLKTNGFQLTLE